MLTEPGLSTIVSAVIGAREIFQRMATYAKYTVAMTFRICFTFGLLTVIYNWCAPGACPSHRDPYVSGAKGNYHTGPAPCSAAATYPVQPRNVQAHVLDLWLGF